MSEDNYSLQENDQFSKFIKRVFEHGVRNIDELLAIIPDQQMRQKVFTAFVQNPALLKKTVDRD